MPFNATQRSTLRQSMRVMIDEVIENSAGAHLVEAISPLRLRSQDELRTQISEDIILFVLSQVSISSQVRESWSQIRTSISCGSLLADQVLKDLSSTPNYDPQRIVELKYFEKALRDKGLSLEACVALMRIREAYLGVTPIDNYSYGENYPTFAYHIGEVPLNLDKMGRDFTIEELQEDIEEIVTERAEIWDETQKEIQKLRQENTGLIEEQRHFKEQIRLQAECDAIKKAQPIFNIKASNKFYYLQCERTFLFNSENCCFNYLKEQLALLSGNATLEFKRGKFSSSHFEDLTSVINSNLEIKNISFNPGALPDEQRKKLEEIIISHKKIAGECNIHIRHNGHSHLTYSFIRMGSLYDSWPWSLKEGLKQIRTEVSVDIEECLLSEKLFAEIVSIIKANPYITSFRFSHDCGLNDEEKNKLQKIAKNNLAKLNKAASLSQSYKWRYALAGALIGVSLPYAFAFSYLAYFVIVPLFCFITSKMGENGFISLKRASENYPDKEVFNNLGKEAQSAFCSGLKADSWKGYLVSYTSLKTYTNRDVFLAGMYHTMTDKEKWQKRASR